MIREILIKEYNNSSSEEVKETISRMFKEAYGLDIKCWEKA